MQLKRTTGQFWQGRKSEHFYAELPPRRVVVVPGANRKATTAAEQA